MNQPILLTLLFIFTAWVARADQGGPHYFGANPGTLPAVKARLAARDSALQPALDELVRDADKALAVTPPTVTAKHKIPPSGDLHDYMSTAPYFWPDPAKADGLPYIRHDGKVNPDSRDPDYDHNRLALMGKTVDTLSLAYYFTGNEAYARHAARCLRVWFLDAATRMNPNLKFAQAVPGENTGRGTGILEGRNLAEAADDTGLLAGSPAWTPADETALKSWLATYLDWLLTSKNGRDEAAARNNHGSWYDVQAMELALVLGRTEVAAQIARAVRDKRIAVQIKPDGRQPLELARTASLGYSCFNLEALYTLATLSGHVGVDLWHFPPGEHHYALGTALDFLLPYAADPEKKWPYDQIKNFNRAATFAPLLRQASLAYQEPGYARVLARLPEVEGERFQLLFPAPAGTTTAAK